MSLLIVGSVALDNILTPTDRQDNVLGGAGTYFSYAASFFTPVQLSGVVGDDFPPEHLQMLRNRNVDIRGVEIRKGEKTFRWTGRYLENMNDRETLETQLNVLGQEPPKLPQAFTNAKYVFLGNAPPSVQMKTLDQLQGADLVAADTMNLWIDVEREPLLELLQRIDGLVLNDSEAKMLTGELNLVTAAKKILEMGLRFVVVKKGEHGSLFLSEHEMYLVPAFPTETVVDPTGAGDSFAGGMMGYLAASGTTSAEAIRTGIVYGTLIASSTVGGFGLDRLAELTKERLDEKLERFRKMVAF
ncbi:MAG: PfkB family carbohydrate kinase [Planctomycetaceae bacterium]|nr:PfkB family carbohydrate kinase [Planctomycetaceae bacterium]